MHVRPMLTVHCAVTCMHSILVNLLTSVKAVQLLLKNIFAAINV